MPAQSFAQPWDKAARQVSRDVIILTRYLLEPLPGKVQNLGGAMGGRKKEGNRLVTAWRACVYVYGQLQNTLQYSRGEYLVLVGLVNF